MLSPLAVATQGIGFSPLLVSVQGLLPVLVVEEEGGSGGRGALRGKKSGRARGWQPLAKEIVDLLEELDLVDEVLTAEGDVLPLEPEVAALYERIAAMDLQTRTLARTTVDRARALGVFRPALPAAPEKRTDDRLRLLLILAQAYL